MSVMSAEDNVTTLRLRLRKAGYHPLPVEGKQPPLEGWPEKIETTDAEIRLWPKLWHFAHNTGINAKFTIGTDVDFLEQEAAEALEELGREHFEERGVFLVRIGRSPKRLFPLRTDEPFPKMSRVLIAPNGTEDKIEILGDGQQWVAFGTHPETGQPYTWHGGDLATTPRESLPYVRREDMEKFLDAAVKLLVEQFGYVEKKSVVETDDGRRHAGEEPQASCERIAAALAVIPNDTDWDGWNRVGMATWRATGGAAEGFAAFDAWSKKSPKYDACVTAQKWAAYFKSPPTEIGAGTIFHLADQASPTWRQDFDAKAARARDNSKPPTNGPDEAPQTARAARHFEPISTFRDPATIPPRRWLYSKQYIVGAVSATIADGGVGKTNLSIAEGIALATGRNILGVDVAEPQHVLYWSGEETIDEIERRVHAVLLHYGIDRSEIVGKFFMLSGFDDPILIARLYHGNLIFDEATIAGIEETVRRLQIGLLLLDPFVSLHRIPENDNTNIEAVVGRLATLAHQCQIALDLDHHVRKSWRDNAEIRVADARGAGALVNKARTARVLNRMTPAQAQTAKVKDHREFIRADNGKANYAPPFAATWFKIIPIELPNGDNVAALEPWKYPSGVDAVRPEHIEAIRAIVGSSNNYRADAQSPEWVGHVIAEVVGLDAEDKADRTTIRKIIKTCIDDGILVRTPRKDETRRPRIFITTALADKEGGDLFTDKADTLTALGNVLAQWREAIGVGRTKSLQEVIDVAAGHTGLRAALVAVAPFNGPEKAISDVLLFRWLQGMNEVVANGLRLQGGGMKEGSPLWTLYGDPSS